MRRGPLSLRSSLLASTLACAVVPVAARAEASHEPRADVGSADTDSSNTPAPDFVGSLRANVQLHAWFNATRTRALLRVGEYTSKLYRAWKVALADLDGDGTSEVVLGVWSSTRRHDEPDPHRAVWVLAWDPVKQELREVWRGSALARPLLDFEMDASRLIALERLDGVCFRTRYQWTGFGFAARSVAREECKK